MNNGQTDVLARIDALKELLADIEEHEFNNVNQVKGLIHTCLESLNKVHDKHYPVDLTEAFLNAEVVEVRL